MNVNTKLANLLTVKSLVTLALTGIFAYLAVTGGISQEFMTIYTVIVSFYFGSQAEKLSQAIQGGGGNGDAKD